MMKYISLLLLVLIGLDAQSQVVINMQLPPSSIYLKNQLWNLSLVNAGSDLSNIRVEVLLSDASNNQPVLSGVSGIIRLKKGITQINSNNASPFAYNVLSPGYNVDANPMGFLPIGIFNICFRVVAVGEIAEQLGEECDVVELDPLSPPQLVLPFDEDTISVNRPLFTWIAPGPQSLMNNPTFDLTLVEVLPMQNSSSAIQQNMPIYFQPNIRLTSQQYPFTYPQLDAAKTYAWQITARSNNYAIAKSEVWTFRIGTEVARKKIRQENFSYARLGRGNDAAFTIANGKLYYEYANEVNEPSVNINIYDISNSRKKISLSADTVAVHLGQNLMIYDLEGEGGFINKHIYLFELHNGRNETWYIKFEYRQPE